MYKKPTTKQLAKIPPMNPENKVPLAETLIYAHFFVGGCDWYAAEYDPKTRQFFGYVNLGDDMCAEWGYFSLDELIEVRVGKIWHVEYDRHWKNKTASEIWQIVDIDELLKEREQRK